MSAQRKYYLFAAACFSIGAILALASAAYPALAIFLVLTAMMLWIQSRADRFIDERRPAGTPSRYEDEAPRPRERRPSERRAGGSGPRR